MFIQVNDNTINTFYIQSITKENKGEKYVIKYRMLNGLILEEEFDSESEMMSKYNSVIGSTESV